MQVKITLTQENHERVKKSSKEYMRTISAEINYMLNKAYETQINTTTNTTTNTTNTTTNTTNTTKEWI